MTLIQEIKQFYQYCNEFYNIKNGLYPIATKQEIVEACDTYIKQVRKISLDFDSIDREQVREIIGK